MSPHHKQRLYLIAEAMARAGGCADHTTVLTLVDADGAEALTLAECRAETRAAIVAMRDAKTLEALNFSADLDPR